MLGNSFIPSDAAMPRKCAHQEKAPDFSEIELWHIDFSATAVCSFRLYALFLGLAITLATKHSHKHSEGRRS